MDILPDEIIVAIFSFFEPSEITTLQLVCHRFLDIGRDDNLWRNECFENSKFLENLRRRNRTKLIPPAPVGEPHFIDLQQALAEDQHGKPSKKARESYDRRDAEHRAKEKMRVMANWDPSYLSEKIDWYAEFIHRTAPISISWFQQPQCQRRQGRGQAPLEVRGISAFYPSDNVDATFAVAPVENGSVCVWDVSGTTAKKGKIIGQSTEGSLNRLGLKNIAIGDGISCVDSERSKAYIAVQNDLIEVDLQTLQSVSHTFYSSPISALSEAGKGPLTMGTSGKLYVYDPRSHHIRSGECPKLSRVESRGEAAEFLIAPESQIDRHIRGAVPYPVPLSIIHLPGSMDNWSDSNDIYVAGRFPSIINYDRRFYGRPRSIIHSGASLSWLTHIPYPFSEQATASRRHAELSMDEVRSTKSAAGDTLVACGAYGSKGSLELYGLSSPSDLSNPPGDSPGDSPGGRILQSCIKNRQTSSSSKLLSVAPHGSRLVFSDGNGNIKWVERDGFTEVRHWSIQHGSVDVPGPRGIFGTLGDSYYMDPAVGDIARKILPTRRNGSPPLVNVDDLLLWTGEKIGMLSFSGKSGLISADFDETAESLEESHQEKAERTYGERMRHALRIQADEVRLMRGLGLSHR